MTYEVPVEPWKALGFKSWVTSVFFSIDVVKDLLSSCPAETSNWSIDHNILIEIAIKEV